MRNSFLLYLVILGMCFSQQANAAISIDAPVSAGSSVGFTGTGAPANGSVELIVNGESHDSVLANASGEFSFSGLNLSAGDQVRVQVSIIWDFEDGTTQGWEVIRDASLTVSNGILNYEPTATLNAIKNQLPDLNGGSFDPSVYRVVEVRMKNNTAGDRINFYYWDTGGFHNREFTIEPNMTEFKTVRFSDHAAIANWGAEGYINQLRLDIEGADSGTVEIDYIRINENIAFEFDVDGDLENLQLYNVTNVSATNGSLSLEATGDNPLIRPQPTAFADWDLDMGVFEQAYIRGSWSTAPGADNILWSWSDAGGGLATNQAFQTLAAGTDQQTVHWDFTTVPTWTATENPASYFFQSIHFIEGATAGDTAILDYIRLTPTNAYGPLDETVVAADPVWLAGSYGDVLLINATYSRTLVEGVDFEDINGYPVTLAIQDHDGAGDGSWLAFGTGASSRTLSGTPTLADEGLSTWTLVADNGVSSATTSIVLTVNNGTPTWLAGPFTDAMLINAPYSLTLSRGIEFEDPDGDPLTLSIEDYQGAGTGAWLTFGTGANSTTLSGTPDAADAGTGVWTLGVSDGSALSTTTLTLDITNTTPVWLTTPSPDALYTGDTFSLTFVEGVDFEDTDGGPLTLSIQSHVGTGDGSWLTFGTGATSRTLSGTPDLADAGISTWTLSLSDSVNVDTTLLTLEVVDPDTVVTVVVDDDAGNDVAYVNGVGGNFTGTSALDDAVEAIDADPSLRNYWEIQIIDTDATTDTYSGTVLSDKANMLIHQVEDGDPGTADVGVVIDAGSDTNNNLIRLNESNSTLAGLSPETPIKVILPAADNPYIALSSSNTAENLRFENIEVQGGGNGRYGANIGASGSVLRNVTLNNSGRGLQIPANDLTVEDCWIAVTGFPIIVLNEADLTMTNSTIVGGEENLHLGGAGRVEMVNCTLDYRQSTSNRIITTPELSDAEILMVDLNLPGPLVNQGLPFFLDNTQTSMTIRSSSPGQKVDLSQIGDGPTVLLRSRNGNITFTDCVIGTNSLDMAGVPAFPNSVTTLTLNRCFVNGTVGNVTTNTVTRVIRATNTIFNADGTNFALVMAQGTSMSLATLAHCTFMGTPSGGELINASNTSATIRADYTIFDGSSADWISEKAVIIGDNNLVVAGTVGGFGGDDSGLTNTVTGNALLDLLTGMPGENSAAIDAAASSGELLDYVTTSRPIGSASDIGALEAPLPQTASKHWSLFD